MRIDHTPIHELLQRTDLLLTVSSTAAIEAVAAGVRAAFVADFVEDAALNPRLLPSGLMRIFDDIDADRIDAPDPGWLDDVFPLRGRDQEPAERFAGELLAVARGDRPRTHAQMWESAFHVSRRTTDRAVAALGNPNRQRIRQIAGRVARRALRVVRA